VVDPHEAREHERDHAAVGGAHEDDGQEKARRHGDAEGEEPQHAVDGEEDEQRVEPELAGGARGEDVARGVRVGGVEQRREVVVVAVGAVELLEVAGLAHRRARVAERRVARRARHGERQEVQPRRREHAHREGERQLRHPSLGIDQVVQPEHLVEDVVVERPEDAAEDADERDGEEVADVVADGDVADVEEDEPALAEHAAAPVPAHLDEAAQHHHDGGRAEEGAPQQRAPPPRRHLLQREQHAADGRAERRAHPGRRAARDQVPAVPVVVEVAQPPPAQPPPALAALAEQVGQARADVHQRPLLAEIHSRRHGADAANDLHRAQTAFFFTRQNRKKKEKSAQPRKEKKSLDLDDELRRAEHVGRVDAVEISLDLGDAGAGGGGGEDDAEHGGDEGEREVDAGEVEEARPVALLADEVDHVLHLEAGDVLDGEVDEGRDDAGEEADEERHGPLEEDVLQHLHVGPAAPVVLEQIVLDDPACQEQNKQSN